jgi:hypothetical protein
MKEIACILNSDIFPNALSNPKKIQESNHVSAIPLSENKWDGIICVLENIFNPN